MNINPNVLYIIIGAMLVTAIPRIIPFVAAKAGATQASATMAFLYSHLHIHGPRDGKSARSNRNLSHS